MTMQTIFIIIALIFVVVFFYLGRQLYLRSVRVKHRLQMGNIFTNITHELLTPLTVISASVDHLREEEPTHEREYDMMQLNIQRMVRLLQQILEASKSQAGELKLKVSHGDVMKYIYETALCLEPLFKRKNLTFNISCTPQSMMGWIDTDKLDKIIYNLLSNAAKYTSEGSVSLDVRTSKNYDHLYIKVSDTGSGISKQQMKQLFQRFFDGEYRRHQTFGTGIGLALTRDLVYLHNGKISAESEEGKGTVLSVWLPITKEAFLPEQIDDSGMVDFNIPKNAIIDVNTAAIPDNYEEDEPEEVDSDDYRILIVEDNIELLMLMHHILKSQYRVYIAHNGKEALDIIHQRPLDLIVSDVMMPEMDGIELTEAVKEDPNYSHLPIILLTAKTQEEDKEEALKTGADEYLTKPFRLGDLKIRIDNIIENRKRIQQDYSQQTSLESHQDAERELSPDEEFLNRAKTCVLKHLDDADYDRDAFAADMGASASTLYNKLRSLTGMNVSTFIRDIRMKEAYRIAQANPDIRVSDLAYRVGFHDPKYFSTSFKKYFGTQPKEFLESLSA
jgi:CheY-like chemotaxis protein